MSTRMSWIWRDRREDEERLGRQSRRLLTVIPWALLLLWQLSPFLELSSPGDIAFVCLGQQFNCTSTWASALLALRIWNFVSSKLRRGEEKRDGDVHNTCKLIISWYNKGSYMLFGLFVTWPALALHWKVLSSMHSLLIPCIDLI